MRRFTILSLMGLVLVLALAIAALRDANDYWAGGSLLATSLLVGTGLLGAAYSTGRRRAGRLGFAVFCGGYFALAFLGLSEPNLAKLPTTWLLTHVHQRVSPKSFSVVRLALANASLASLNSRTHYVPSNVSPQPMTGPATTGTTSQVWQAISANPVGLNRWKAILPGAANDEAFRVVGHCLFALLAGVLGVAIARWFEARQPAAWGPVPSRSVRDDAPCASNAGSRSPTA